MKLRLKEIKKIVKTILKENYLAELLPISTVQAGTLVCILGKRLGVEGEEEKNLDLEDPVENFKEFATSRQTKSIYLSCKNLYKAATKDDIEVCEVLLDKIFESNAQIKFCKLLIEKSFSFLDADGKKDHTRLKINAENDEYVKKIIFSDLAYGSDGHYATRESILDRLKKEKENLKNIRNFTTYDMLIEACESSAKICESTINFIESLLQNKDTIDKIKSNIQKAGTICSHNAMRFYQPPPDIAKNENLKSLIESLFNAKNLMQMTLAKFRTRGLIKNSDAYSKFAHVYTFAEVVNDILLQVIS